jgi:hypothetical protein
MNAPPVSEATFMLEEACNAMLEPETRTEVGCGEVECGAELTWAGENSENARRESNAVENSFISETEFPNNQIQN